VSENEIYLPDDYTNSLIAATFKLISDPTRLKILYLLCRNEECVSNIAALLSMSSPAVAHHLKLLKSQGLLSSRREGKEVYYKLTGTRYAEGVRETVDTMFKSRCSVCTSARSGIKCGCKDKE